MGNTPGTDSSPDDEGDLGRKRPRSPDIEIELVHVPKKQRRDLAIAITTTKPPRSSKKRAHSPECDDPVREDGVGGDDGKKRRRVRRETEHVSRGRKSAEQLPSAPPTPPPPAFVDRQYSREVAQIESIRAGLQDIERRLARLAQLCDEDGGTEGAL